jgi:peroxiredoxin Q/BCP
LGISFDTVEENRAFAEKFDFPFPLLCDTSRSIGLAYGACADTGAQYANRISYLIGPNGKIVKAYEKVDPSKHPEEVLQDL